MPLLDAELVARRVRAARAYAGLTRAQLVQRTPLTAKQLQLLEAGERPKTTRDELHAIARGCGVPIEFMDVGFHGAAGYYERIGAIVAALLSQDLEQIRRVAEELGIEPRNAETLPPDRDEAFRPRDQEQTPSARHQPAADGRPEEAAKGRTRTTLADRS